MGPGTSRARPHGSDKKRAIVAVGHSLFRLIYQMLSTNFPYRKAAEVTEYKRLTAADS